MNTIEVNKATRVRDSVLKYYERVNPEMGYSIKGLVQQIGELEHSIQGAIQCLFAKKVLIRQRKGAMFIYTRGPRFAWSLKFLGKQFPRNSRGNNINKQKENTGIHVEHEKISITIHGTTCKLTPQEALELNEKLEKALEVYTSKE